MDLHASGAEEVTFGSRVEHANHVSQGIVHEAAFMTVVELGTHDDGKFGFGTIVPDGFT